MSTYLGWSLPTIDAVKQFTIVFQRLKSFNDSKDGFESSRDRHENLAQDSKFLLSM